jgi:RND superfamily putative drug exporter
VADGSTDVARGRGVFERLAGFVVRWPLFVVAFWIMLAAMPLVMFPPLPVVAAQQQPAALPDDAPTMVATREISAAFGAASDDNGALVVLTNEHGLTPADEQTYRRLVEALNKDTASVKSVQDFLSAPPLREVLQSKDKKAWNLPVLLVGSFGSPEGRVALDHMAETVQQSVKGSTLTAQVTGPAATAADLADVGEHDMHLVEIGTGVLVLLILLVVYRNPLTMLLPLITIVLSLVTAQGLLSGFALMGLPVSPMTMVLLTAVMVGAGTDYAVFLISRYHDYVRQGLETHEAVTLALASIGKVIAASAATVAVTFVVMVFAKLPTFFTVGPAISIAIAVVFAAAVTLLPAIMVLVGPRGWIKPRRSLTTRFWHLSGIRVVRRPKIHLAASLAILICLGSCVSLIRFNYDDRKTLPDSVASAAGYATMVRHFSLDALIPQFLVIQSPHDMRTPESLADLEQLASRVSKVPGVSTVRGVTRPTGEPLEQAKATYQAGEVGSKLDAAADQIETHDNDLTTLTGGANTLANSLGLIRGQIGQTIGTVGVLVDSLSTVQTQMGGKKALKDLDDAAKLIDGMHALGAAIGVNHSNITTNINWIPPVLAALNGNPVCDSDPSCSDSRMQMQMLVTARDNGTLDQVFGVAGELQATQPSQSIDSTVKGLRQALDTAGKALHTMGLDRPGGLRDQLSQLQQGADALAAGSRAVADGVQILVDQTRRLGGGLSQASDFLLSMKKNASAPSMAGFYIPAQILTQTEFKTAAASSISPDGKLVRYLVSGSINPFSTDAMDQVNAMTAAGESALPNTTLADAKVSVVGVSSGLRDTRDYYADDFRFFLIATFLIVLLILIILLRSIVAPLYLIGSVMLSYLSALGLGVLVFQVILGQELHWSVPGLAFILLVAVGADYNLLLISRIREESPHGLRLGVIRTLASTGGVITSAGLIFAASMLGLMFASITTMLQIGFVIGMGILLDTFLVRTVTVPAIAVLVGDANWWPHQWFPGTQSWFRSKQARRKTRRAAPPDNAAAVEEEDQFAAATSNLDFPTSPDDGPEVH